MRKIVQAAVLGVVLASGTPWTSGTLWAFGTAWAQPRELPAKIGTLGGWTPAANELFAQEGAFTRVYATLHAAE